MQEAEGRERAKRPGVKLGRKPKLSSEQRREAIKRRDEGKETRAEIARRFNDHPSVDFKTNIVCVDEMDLSTRSKFSLCQFLLLFERDEIVLLLGK
jgi:hypothetical protein